MTRAQAERAKSPIWATLSDDLRWEFYDGFIFSENNRKYDFKRFCISIGRTDSRLLHKDFVPMNRWAVEAEIIAGLSTP